MHLLTQSSPSTNSTTSSSQQQQQSQSQTESNMLNELYPNLMNVLTEYHGELVQTGSPMILCSSLPPHWRSNKSLPCAFKVIVLDYEIPDNTEVVITAGNEDECTGAMKNNTAVLKNGVAKFNDLRFVGRSGRGRFFTVVITIRSSINPQTMNPIPELVATYNKAIKVTVDGQRAPRSKQGMGYGHPSGLNPFVMHPAWFEVAYMNYAMPEYFRQPQILGTIPPTVFSNPLRNEFNPMPPTPTVVPAPAIFSSHSAATVMPPQPVPTGAYLPTPLHPFAPELLSKNQFVPHESSNLRNILLNGRPAYHVQHNTSLPSESNRTQEQSNTLHGSSTSSSPLSSQHSDSASNDSDDELIDVVHSSHVPTLAANPIIVDQTDAKSRCNLKAPSARKPIHETASTVSRLSETKIKLSSAQKAVWRPY